MRDIAHRRHSLLTAERLTWEHCQSLAPRLAREDATECTLLGHTALQALAMGAMMGGHCAIRQDTGTPVGAWGYTPEGTIWSLWAKLAPCEKLQVIEGTASWVAALVASSGFPKLYNFAHVDNKPALDWLRRSKAFAITETPVNLHGADYLYFETKVPHV